MTQEELSKRDQRSQNLRVFQINDQEYFVESSKGQISYKVALQNGHTTCTCADFANNIQNDSKFKCKHILAVVNGNGNVQKLDTIKQKPKLDDRWITSIKGKDFVVYSGLLDLAHQVGLKSIQVEVIQYPTKDNGNEAICKATTHSKDGQLFEDYGDANPKNTNSLVVNHILRVAATRAKARTLRDMTNIGMTCLEELGDEEIDANTQPSPKKQAPKEQSKAPANPQKPKTQETKKTETSGSKSTPDNGGNGSAKPSSSQLSAIKNLAYRRGLSDQDIDNLAKDKLEIPSLHELSADQAGRFIKILQQSA